MKNHSPTKVLLIDLATKESKEKLQVQITNDLYATMNEGQEIIFAQLESLITDLGANATLNEEHTCIDMLLRLAK